jgi:hypothetical protein
MPKYNCCLQQVHGLMIAFSNRVLKFAKEERKNESLNSLSIIFLLKFKFTGQTLKRQCQLQCIARSNNAWRPFYWQSNSCFGFQSVIYFNHPMVILAHFNRIVTTKHQRNVYNRYLLTFHHFQGKCKQMHCG